MVAERPEILRERSRRCSPAGAVQAVRSRLASSMRRRASRVAAMPPIDRAQAAHLAAVALEAGTRPPTSRCPGRSASTACRRRIRCRRQQRNADRGDDLVGRERGRAVAGDELLDRERPLAALRAQRHARRRARSGTAACRRSARRWRDCRRRCRDCGSGASRCGAAARRKTGSAGRDGAGHRYRWRRRRSRAVVRLERSAATLQRAGRDDLREQRSRSLLTRRPRSVPPASTDRVGMPGAQRQQLVERARQRRRSVLRLIIRGARLACTSRPPAARGFAAGGGMRRCDDRRDIRCSGRDCRPAPHGCASSLARARRPAGRRTIAMTKPGVQKPHCVAIRIDQRLLHRMQPVAVGDRPSTVRHGRAVELRQAPSGRN